jgi:hypothetical protein
MGQAAPAQSGRAPKRNDSPPTKPAAAEPEVKSTSKTAKAMPVRVMAAEYIPSANVAFETGMVYRSLLGRLQESSHLTVDPGKEMRRKDAIDLAKSKTEAYVVWLQLEVDLMGSGDVEKDSEKAAISPINPSCLFVTYALFAPETGRAITQGHVYQPGYEDRCVGGVYHPSPYPEGPNKRRAPAEYALKQAGREVADRVMTVLNIPVPPKHP